MSRRRRYPVRSKPEMYVQWGSVGVGGAARGHGAERNTRGPSARPPSRQRGSYKPSAKASAAQRESEGTVVVTRLATNNAGGAISPLLSNIYLHVLDTVWTQRYAHLGVLVRYADDSW